MKRFSQTTPTKRTYADHGDACRAANALRDFLADGLVDHMHLAQVPIVLGRAVRLWDGLEGLEKDYEFEATSSAGGVTHVTFTRPVSETVSIENPGRG